MDLLHPHCAGLDVHKKTVVACVRHQQTGGTVQRQLRTFGTMSADLLALADWLAAEQVTHVAMESTGVYWKPIYNLLEGRFEVLLVNAQHIKNVPGRKTDVKDCEWIAQLLQHGLLRASFVPERPQREWRDLTRQRTQLIDESSAVANRIQKVLEDANIKLSSVASDVLGQSGRDMILALIAGQDDPAELAQKARGRLRSKAEALQRALAGRLREHHRFMLQLLMDHLTHLEELIGRLHERIEELLRPFQETIDRLDAIPGLNRTTIETVLAEIGLDMSRFPTAGHLASWAGLCPGQNESAGKQRSGRTRPANRWLRRAMVQAAWAASHTKQSYLGALYGRLAARRGRKRALLAVGRTLLEIVYHMLQRGTAYQELGPDYLDRRDSERTTRRLVERLEKLGHHVVLLPNTEPAA